MIGDNSLNDIKGARQHVNALTFQKIHKGVDIGKCDQKPDVAFSNYSELRKLLKKWKVKEMVTDHEISDFKRLCSVIGKDPLIVQGAGGNASWKNQDKI